MEVINNSYVLTAKDLIEARHLSQLTSKQFKSSLLQLLLCLSLIVLVLYRIKDPYFLVLYNPYEGMGTEEIRDYTTSEAIVVIIGYILFLGITFPRYNIFTRWSITRKYQQNFVIKENKNISINGAGLTIESENYRESRKWQDCDRIVENSNIFLLFYSREKESIVIPKRIFNEPSKLNTFRDFIKNIY